MCRRWIGLAGFALFACSACGGEPAQKTGPGVPELKSTRNQASYALGVNIGRSLRDDGLDVNVDAVVQGLRDMLGQYGSCLSPRNWRTARKAPGP